jgi:hypothetical protein
MKKAMQPARIPQELVTGWHDTLVQWPQKPAHDRLLGCAVKHNHLAWLATRYREAARGNPHDAIARDRLKAVQRAASMLVLATPLREPARKSHRGIALLLAAAAASIFLGLWSANYIRVHHSRTFVSRQP